jgi:predicted nucleotidyltransferase/HEPN domain-containing protein
MRVSEGSIPHNCQREDLLDRLCAPPYHKFDRKRKAAKKAVMPRKQKQMKLAMALKQALLDSYDPEAIILFGSLGRGDADEFSDVDLLVVMETDKNVKDLSEEVAEYLTPLSKDKHIIVRTPEDVSRQRDIPGTLVYSAIRDGQILFEKTDWSTRHLPETSYEMRKKEVIDREYVRSANGFLVQATRSLQRGNLFRCRDFARFAAARVIKGLLVKYDVHPPRETDLLKLLDKAKQLESDLVKHRRFIQELNHYCPGNAEPIEALKSRTLLKRTARFVREIIARYGLD